MRDRFRGLWPSGNPEGGGWLLGSVGPGWNRDVVHEAKEQTNERKCETFL
jgi:hypothetical protein